MKNAWAYVILAEIWIFITYGLIAAVIMGGFFLWLSMKD